MHKGMSAKGQNRRSASASDAYTGHRNISYFFKRPTTATAAITARTTIVPSSSFEKVSSAQLTICVGHSGMPVTAAARTSEGYSSPGQNNPDFSELARLRIDFD